MKGRKMNSDKQWKPWIELCDESFESIEDIVCDTPVEYRLLVGSALSVAKWHPKRKDKRGEGYCGLCAYMNKLDYSLGCKECPLKIAMNMTCVNGGSLWDLAVYEKSERKRVIAMDKLYATLMDLYRKEYKKVMGK